MMVSDEVRIISTKSKVVWHLVHKHGDCSFLMTVSVFMDQALGQKIEEEARTSWVLGVVWFVIGLQT